MKPGGRGRRKGGRLLRGRKAMDSPACSGRVMVNRSALYIVVPDFSRLCGVEAVPLSLLVLTYQQIVYWD